MKRQNKSHRKLEVVENRVQRINLKSKRKRTVIKKVIEFSQLFDLDILMIIHDKEMHKVFEYNSGSQKSGFFSFDNADLIRKQAL